MTSVTAATYAGRWCEVVEEGDIIMPACIFVFCSILYAACRENRVWNSDEVFIATEFKCLQ